MIYILNLVEIVSMDDILDGLGLGSLKTVFNDNKVHDSTTIILDQRLWKFVTSTGRLWDLLQSLTYCIIICFIL